MTARTNRLFTARGTFGLALVTIGVLALFSFYNPHFRWEDYWPLGFAVWGVARFANQGARGWFFSAALVFVGVYMTLEFTEPYFYWRLQRIVDWDMVWPLALVGVGGYLIMRNLNRDKVDTTAVGEKSEKDTLSVLAILGGNTTRVSSKQFRGGSATAVLGGAEIDLREAKMLDGMNSVVVDANAILGGVEIYLPSEWAVKVKGTPLLGSIEDQRSTKPSPESANQTLVIDGLAVMGSIEIKG